jgi:D-inositol-3-phosphate glycosyltransferase
MKILQVAERTYPAKGGVELHTAMITQELVKMGHDVTIVTFNSMDQRDCGFGLTYQKPFIVTKSNKPCLPESEIWNGVKILRFPSRAQVLSYYWSPGMLNWLIQHINEFDVVHTHCFRFSNNEFTALASLLNKRKVPLVFTCHDVAQLNYMGLPALVFDEFYRKTVGRALMAVMNKLIALTQTNAKEYTRFLHADPKKIRIVPNGIDFEKYQNLPDGSDLRAQLGNPEQIILYIGRFISYKNPHKLISAFTEISKKYPKSHLLMIGKDYGLCNECKTMTNSQVTILEDADEEIKLKALAIADVCVIPSSYEGFGIVALEAQASGVPVIATKSGGLNHVIENGVTGLHVDSPDPLKISDALSYLLDNPELRQKMACEAKLFSKNFSWKSVAEMLEKIYADAIRNNIKN